MQLWFRAALAAVLCFASFSGASAQGASPDEIWREVREADVARTPRARQIVPERYRSFALNRGRLAALLATAPHERARAAAQSSLALSLPLPDGGYGLFTVVESPIMEAGLAARYPALKTYLGQGVDDPTATVRFDVTPKGFHAQVIAAGGTVLIDPFQPGDLDHYIAYRKHDHRDGKRGICLVTGEPMTKAHAMSHAKVASGATLRTYRLAMAATGEYTAFHGGTVIDALSAIVTTMNRVNGIYEREVSVRMVLVANNDRIIYTDAATDPYANTSNDLNANQSTVDAQIGSANYDIGHLVGTGGGGIAQLRSPCGASKARGLTGSAAPVGDAFDIDYVAHEMGHQFGGNHTFNGSGGSCAGTNRNATTAYEPGSGITIQAYAGICGGDDLQPNSEDYFHRVSLDEILAFTTNAGTGASCGAASSTGNAVPTVSTASGFSIPGRTPFTLTAAGLDANGDTLTYVWEQMDVGTANSEGVLDPTTLTGPMFRSFNPSTDPTRTFPSWRWILATANVPPATAPLPGTTTPAWMTGEVLPNAARTLAFRVTARDNRAGGGGTNDASTTVTVVNTAGPFAVTAPNTAVSLAAGASTPVTWNVALSNLAPISAADVRITLSTDGGNTFPLELIASTPNDGSESVTLPAGVASTQARIRVQAVGNIFFDVSDTDFTLTSANTPPAIAVTGSLSTRQGSPLASAVVATVSDAQQAASSLGVIVSGAPSELATSVQNAAGSVTLSATAQCSLVAPTTGSKVYPLTLTATDGVGGVSSATVNVNVSANRVPTLGAYAVLNMTRSSSRQLAPAGVATDADGNLSTVTVSPTALPGGGTVAVAADGTLSVTTTAGTTLGTHALTVAVGDACGAVESRTVTLNVAAPQVVIALAGSQVLTGNALIEPNECNQVNVSLRNDGNTPATGVSATLSTGTANTSITQATAAFPDIPPGESRTSITPFEVSTTAAATCFSTINGSLSVSFGGAAGSPATTPMTLPVGRAAATNYVFAASSGATLPNDGVLVAGSNGDDTGGGGAAIDPIVTVTAPFAFSLYGTSYPAGTALRASTNGNLQFRPTQGALDFANTALPAAGTGNGQAVFPATAPTLFVLWDDWRMDVAEPAAAPDAGIYTKLEGVAPNRRWIIEWRGRIRGDGAVTTNNNRAAIVLNENGGSNANAFEYIYLLTGAGAAANGAGSTIGIQAAASGAVFTQFALDNANLAPGTRLTATQPPAVCAAGSGACAAPPGVTITQSAGTTAVVEGGATDSYTVVLNSAPSASVTVGIAPDAQLTTSPSPGLTFTTANWNVPQTVTVTAANDAIAEGAHSGTITHSASGGGYTGVSIATVVASIGDNDTAGVTVAQSGGTTVVAEGGASDSYTLVLTSQPTAGVTITLSPDAQVSTPASVSFTALDWNVPKNVTVTAVNDAVAEGAHTGTITHAAAGGGYTGVAVANVVASISDNDTAGVTIVQSGGSTSVAEGGATDSYSLVLTSQPGANVTIGITPDAQLATVASVVFTPGNWNVPQDVTVTAVDDALAEGMHSGTITHPASGGGYTGVAVGNVVASIADNEPTPVDLAVAAIGVGMPVAGQRFSYDVVVDNLTATPVPSAAFAFTPPALLTNVSWTCAPGAGSTCPASGANAPAHAVGLAANGTLVYTIGGDVPAATAAGTLLTGNATIGVSAPFQDSAPANNADTTVDTVQDPAVFRNGFEGP
jgi:hypothetical protein